MLSNKDVERVIEFLEHEDIPKGGVSASVLKAMCKKKYVTIDSATISSKDYELLVDVLSFPGVKVNQISVNVKEKGQKMRKKLLGDNIDKLIAMKKLRRELEG